MRNRCFGVLAPLAAAGVLGVFGIAGVVVPPSQAQAAPAVAKDFSGIHKAGQKYYVYKQGKPLARSGSVGKTWYAVASKGRLLSGKGTRIVKVQGKSYRVKADGKALKGWSSDKTRWFDQTGLMATGVRVIGGKLYRFGTDGTLDTAATAAVRAAAAPGSDAGPLIELLGKPTRTVMQGNCADGGTDKLYFYRHVVVTARTVPGNAVEEVVSVAAA